GSEKFFISQHEFRNREPSFSVMTRIILWCHRFVMHEEDTATYRRFFNRRANKNIGLTDLNHTWDVEAHELRMSPVRMGPVPEVTVESGECFWFVNTIDDHSDRLTLFLKNKSALPKSSHEVLGHET